MQRIHPHSSSLEAAEGYLKRNLNAMVADLAQLISIPTVYGAPAPGAPLGKEIARGVEWLSRRAETMGLSVRHYDGYALEIDAGNGDYTVGIVCHLDVVDAGANWTVPPFQGLVQGNRIYGRGAIDDKGPLIACLYGMRYLLESGQIPAGSRVRMIVGTDEEEGFQGIRYYASRSRFPDISFIPDGSFPLIYGEKGLYDFDLIDSRPVVRNRPVLLTALKGGIGRNSVPAEASCLLQIHPGLIEETHTMLSRHAAAHKLNILLETIADGLSVFVKGAGTHAMSPEKGFNAVSALIGMLGALETSISHSAFLQAYNQTIGMDYSGAAAGIACTDNDSGPLTLNIGQVELEKDVVTLRGNIRYPMSLKADEMHARIKSAFAQAGYAVNVREHLAPVCFSQDSKLVTNLLQAYREVTGDSQTQPITIGGATYTRFVPNAVAFGPVWAHQEELAHEPDEYLDIDQLRIITAIYIQGMLRLLTH